MNGDTYELYVGEKMIAWLCERPKYCNRGHYHAGIEAPLPVRISENDWWPRYYFNLTYGMSEIESWLSGHGVNLDRAKWKLKSAQEINGGPVIDMDRLVDGESFSDGNGLKISSERVR